MNGNLQRRMIMRAIDADSLNNYKFGENLMASSYADGWDDAIDAIMKDAPTVEVRDNFDIGYAQGLEDGRNERPKGKWHKIKTSCDIGHKFYICSKCNREIDVMDGECLDDYPFCHCGADMREEESA
jgi:hypothetical protein